MPYTLAFHTAFREPVSFSADLQKCCAVDDRYIATGDCLPLNQTQMLYKRGFVPNGSKISGIYTACGHTARIGKYTMTVSEQFDHWVLFNEKATKAICVSSPNAVPWMA